MPLTRGHVLVVPRQHLENLGQVGVEAAREVCIIYLYFFFFLVVFYHKPSFCV